MTMLLLLLSLLFSVDFVYSWHSQTQLQTVAEICRRTRYRYISGSPRKNSIFICVNIFKEICKHYLIALKRSTANNSLASWDFRSISQLSAISAQQVSQLITSWGKGAQSRAVSKQLHRQVVTKRGEELNQRLKLYTIHYIDSGPGRLSICTCTGIEVADNGGGAVVLKKGASHTCIACSKNFCHVIKAGKLQAIVVVVAAASGTCLLQVPPPRRMVEKFCVFLIRHENENALVLVVDSAREKLLTLKFLRAAVRTFSKWPWKRCGGVGFGSVLTTDFDDLPNGRFAQNSILCCRHPLV